MSKQRVTNEQRALAFVAQAPKGIGAVYSDGGGKAAPGVIVSVAVPRGRLMLVSRTTESRVWATFTGDENPAVGRVEFSGWIVREALIAVGLKSAEIPYTASFEGRLQMMALVAEHAVEVTAAALGKLLDETVASRNEAEDKVRKLNARQEFLMRALNGGA